MEALRSSDPETIGPFTLIARLGSGGMGVVYLATQEKQPVALKVIRGNFVDDSSLSTRFTREIKTLQKLDSPFIAPIRGSSVDEDIAWLAVDYVNGPSLLQKVSGEGPVSEALWWEIAIGSLIALAEVHEKRIVHRDVKPANLLLSETGPKLIDFGISHAQDETSLTSTGLVAGSPAWLAPEQLDVGDVGPPADVFSLASVLTFASTGESPWGNHLEMSVPIVFNKILSENPRLESISDLQRKFLTPMLEKDASNRPTALEQLTLALRQGPDLATQRIANWISLHYLNREEEIIPDAEVAGKTLQLLEKAGTDNASRLVSAALSEAEKIRREAVVEAEQLKSEAEKDISQAKRKLGSDSEALAKYVLATRQKADREADRLISQASKKAEKLTRPRSFRKQPAVIAGLSAVAIIAIAVSVVLGGGFGVSVNEAQNLELTPENSTETIREVYQGPAIVNLTTISNSGRATLTPGDGSVLEAGKRVTFTLEFDQEYAFEDGVWPEFQLSLLRKTPGLETCGPGFGQISQNPSDKKLFSVGCEIAEPGEYVANVVWTLAGQDIEGRKFEQESISAFIRAISPESEEATEPPATPSSANLSFEFLGGSGDSWWHPPLYSMTNNNLSRFVCFPGDPYAEDNLQAWGRDGLVRILNPDGSAGEILGFSEPTGGCIVEAGKGLPIWEGQEGGGFRLRVTSDQLLSRTIPGQCLNLRFDGGTGNSFNDVCVR